MTAEQILKSDRLIVHGGTFHADDLMCAAMMKLINPGIVIERLRDVPENIDERTVVCDIGHGEFDHHQADAEKDASGHVLCAAELLYRKIKDVLPITDKSNFENILFRIGQNDNAESRDGFCSLLLNFNAEWDESDIGDGNFMIAAELLAKRLEEDPDFVKRSAKKIPGISDKFWKRVDETTLMFFGNGETSRTFYTAAECRYFKHRKAAIRATEIIRKALRNSDGEVIVLPTYMPVGSLAHTSVKFVVYKSSRSGYSLLALHDRPGSCKRRALISESAKDMPGLIFIHPLRFIAEFDTEEQALAAAKLSLAASTTR